MTATVSVPSVQIAVSNNEKPEIPPFVRQFSGFSQLYGTAGASRAAQQFF